MNIAAPTAQSQLAYLNRRYLSLRSEIERERSMLRYPGRLIQECTDIRNEIVAIQSDRKTAYRKGVNP